MAEKIELNSVGKCDPHSDPTHLAQSWERWHRNFELFAAGKGPYRQIVNICHMRVPGLVDEDEGSIIGVDLVQSDLCVSQSSSLGVILLKKDQLQHGQVTLLRQEIKQQLDSCPETLTICSKEGWTLTEDQEKQLYIRQILTNQNTVLIKVKYEQPKIGIKDRSGSVIGFIFCSYNEKLCNVKPLAAQEVMNPKGLTSKFNFLDGNNWPVSSEQENHMTVSHLLIGSCIHTDVRISQETRSPEFSPPNRPPSKRLKGCKELSFGSSKDLSWQPSTDCDGTNKQILISYVRAEAAQHALILKEKLASLGFSVYLDVHEIQSGVDWQDSLNFAVSGCEVFVPLVTTRYGETQWTNREVKLADVLGKHIMPVSFLSEWPPRCLAIQFATTQFIPWKSLELLNQDFVDGVTDSWEEEHVASVANQIADRVTGLSLVSLPSLMKRKTVVRSCACVRKSNELASVSDREGKSLIVVCIHPQELHYAQELQTFLEGEGFEVWCSTELEQDFPDSLPDSQPGAGLSQNGSEGRYASIQLFQEKADDAGIVIVVISKAFSMSKTCQQQAFYCEHRKRVIPLQYEEFCLPGWMSMLMGTQGFESRKQENYKSSLLSRVKRALDPGDRNGAKSALSETQISIGVLKLKETISTNTSVYISGGTKFYNSSTEEICRCLGANLATLTSITMVTGGCYGVGETVARAFYEETQRLWRKHDVWHVLPEYDPSDRSGQANQNKDGTFQAVSFGKTLYCGKSMRDRETIAARTLPVCILIEGGPGAAHEAEEFSWNDHVVIPVQCTGGAASGKFNVPSKIFDVPAGASETEWKVLSDPTTPVPTLVQAVTQIVATLLRNLQVERQQISHSQSSPAKETANQFSPSRKLRSPGWRQANVTFGNFSVSPPSNKPSLTSMKTVIL